METTNATPRGAYIPAENEKSEIVLPQQLEPDAAARLAGAARRPGN